MSPQTTVHQHELENLVEVGHSRAYRGALGRERRCGEKKEPEPRIGSRSLPNTLRATHICLQLTKEDRSSRTLSGGPTGASSQNGSRDSLELVRNENPDRLGNV